jgi:CHASE3 domain sensor protein
MTTILGFLTGILSLTAAALGVWNNRKIKTVHTLVNQARDDSVNRIDQLTSAITDAGNIVPPNGKGGK